MDSMLDWLLDEPRLLVFAEVGRGDGWSKTNVCRVYACGILGSNKPVAVD